MMSIRHFMKIMVVLVFAGFGAVAHGAQVTYDLYVNQSGVSWRLYATVSDSDNGGLNTYGVNLTGVTTVQNLAPAAYDSLSNLTSDDTGFVLFRSGANQAAISGGQNFASAGGLTAEDSAVIHGVGQFGGSLPDSDATTQIQTAYTSPVLLARGTFAAGQQGAVGVAQAAASVFKNATDMTVEIASVTQNVIHYTPGDVDRNGMINAADIDAVFAGIGDFGSIGAFDPLEDIDEDGDIDRADVDQLVQGILATQFGDVNLDQRVSIGDLVVLAENFDGPGGWGMGDVTGDGRVSIGDLVVLAENFGTMTGGPLLGGASIVAVPAPGTLGVGVYVLACMMLRRNRRSALRTSAARKKIRKTMKKGLAADSNSCIL